MGYNNIKGSKEDELKNTTDVLPLIRKYIKEKYPNVKFSLVNQRGGTTYSFSLKFTELPFNPFTEEYLTWYSNAKLNNFTSSNDQPKRYNDKYKSMVENIKMFQSQYNHNYSDAMTDYFDYRFYFFIDIDYDYEQQLLNGSLKKISKKDIEQVEFKEIADRLTENNTKSTFFICKKTSNGNRYYQMGMNGSLWSRPRDLLVFMDNNGYKYSVRYE